MDTSLEGLWVPPRGTFELSGPVVGRVTSFQALATGTATNGEAVPPAGLTSAPLGGVAPTRRRGQAALTGAGMGALIVGAAVAWSLSSTPVSAPPPAPAASATIAPASAAVDVLTSTAAVPAAAVSAAPSPAAPSPAAPEPAAVAAATPASAAPVRLTAASEPARPRVVVPVTPTVAATVPPAAPMDALPVTPTAAVAAIVTAPPTAAPTPVSQAASARLVASTQVQGGASSAELKSALAKVEREAQACVAALGPLPAGRAASVVFTIDGDGFFGDPRTTGDAALARCLGAATRGVGRLARRPDTGEVVVTYAFKTEAP